MNCWPPIVKKGVAPPEWEVAMQRWYKWLHDMKKKKKNDEEKRKGEEHQKLVSRMIACAQGGTFQLHKITKPTAWRGGVQILNEEQEIVKPSARCEEKRKELAKHWHSDTEVQVQKTGHGEVGSCKKGMPRLRESEL